MELVIFCLSLIEGQEAACSSSHEQNWEHENPDRRHLQWCHPSHEPRLVRMYRKSVLWYLCPSPPIIPHESVSIDLGLWYKSNSPFTTIHLCMCSCWAMKTATVDMGADRITSNIMAGVPSAVNHIPGKWKNIQAIHLHSSTTGVSLPIYQSLRVATQVCSKDGPYVPIPYIFVKNVDWFALMVCIHEC